MSNDRAATDVPGRDGARPTTRGGDTCPVCFHRPTPKRIDLGIYELYACGNCGSWSSDAAARGADTSFDPGQYFENTGADQARWADVLARATTVAGPLQRALDVGCGNGAYLDFLTKQRPGIQLEGIELDPARAEQARQRNPLAQIHEGDAQNTAENLERPFDFVSLWDVFEHVPEPTRLLGTLAQKLRPGGCIYVQTIHENSLVPAAGRMSYRLSGGRIHYGVRRTHEAHHLVFFSLAGIEEAAAQAGLRVEQRWFNRLAHARMDGPGWLTRLTSMALAAENAWGNGLFVNAILVPR